MGFGITWNIKNLIWAFTSQEASSCGLISPSLFLYEIKIINIFTCGVLKLQHNTFEAISLAHIQYMVDIITVLYLEPLQKLSSKSAWSWDRRSKAAKIVWMDEDVGWGRQCALLQLKEQRELEESEWMICPQRGSFPHVKEQRNFL